MEMLKNPKQLTTIVKTQGITGTNAASYKRRKQPTENNKGSAGKINSATKTLALTIAKMTKSLKLSVHPLSYMERQTTLERNATIGPMQRTGIFPEKNKPAGQNGPHNRAEQYN